MTEEQKKAHLNFEHKGEEQKYALEGCVLCQNYLNNSEKGEDIAVDISDKTSMSEAIM